MDENTKSGECHFGLFPKMLETTRGHQGLSKNILQPISEVTGWPRNEDFLIFTKIWKIMKKSLKYHNSSVFEARKACHTILETSRHRLSACIGRSDLAASIEELWGHKESKKKISSSHVLKDIETNYMAPERYPWDHWSMWKTQLIQVGVWSYGQKTCQFFNFCTFLGFWNQD